MERKASGITPLAPLLLATAALTPYRAVWASFASGPLLVRWGGRAGGKGGCGRGGVCVDMSATCVVQCTEHWLRMGGLLLTPLVLSSTLSAQYAVSFSVQLHSNWESLVEHTCSEAEHSILPAQLQSGKLDGFAQGCSS